MNVFMLIVTDETDETPYVQVFTSKELAEQAEFEFLADLYQGNLFEDEQATREVDVAGTNSLDDLREMFADELEHFGTTPLDTRYWLVETELQGS